MRRGRFTIIGALLLAGCATSGDVTHNKPTFQGSTAKLDAAYARCVHSRWVTMSPTARIIETPTSLEITVSNATTDVEELLVIHSKVDGADVVLYERLQVLALRGYREAAKVCL